MPTATEQPPAAWPGRAERASRAAHEDPSAGMLLVLLAVAAGTWAVWSTTIDDAYITYRYALNWAAGDGPTWNPGADPVEGFTNFAWTAWHAGFLALGVPPAALPVVSALTSAACAVATGRLLLRETRTRTGRFVALGGYLLFVPTYVHVVAGLETAAFALVVLRAVIVGIRVLDGRAARAWELPLLLLVAGMLRPEGVVAVAPALVCLLARRGGEPAVRVWTGLAAVAGAGYAGWRWSYYGYPLPNTFYVKFGDLDAGGRWVTATAVALGGLLVLLALLAVRRATVRPGLLAAATVLLLWAPYALSGPSMDYLHRFAFHALPVLCLAAGLALDAARPRAVAAVTSALAVGWTALAGVTAPDAPVILNYGADLQRTHLAIGRGLAAAPVPVPERTVAVSDAGAIPYASGWTAIDYIGLNDEEIAHGASPTRVVAAARPAVVVVTGGSGGPPARAYGLDVAAVTAGYQQVAAVELRPGYRQYVFVRAPWAGPVGESVRAEVDRARAASDHRTDETWSRWAARTFIPR